MEYKYTRKEIIDLIIKHNEKIHQRTYFAEKIGTRFDTFAREVAKIRPDIRVKINNRYCYTEYFKELALKHVPLVGLRYRPTPTHEDKVREVYNELSATRYTYRDEKYVPAIDLKRYMNIFCQTNYSEDIRKLLKGKVKSIVVHHDEILWEFKHYERYYELETSIKLLEDEWEGELNNVD